MCASISNAVVIFIQTVGKHSLPMADIKLATGLASAFLFETDVSWTV